MTHLQAKSWIHEFHSNLNLNKLHSHTPSCYAWLIYRHLDGETWWPYISALLCSPDQTLTAYLE